MNVALEAIGILGGILILFAFVQLALNKWDGKSFWYEACNALAGALLLYYTIEKKAYVNAVLNFIWGVIALYVILHSVHRHKIRKKKKSRHRKN